MMRQTQLYSDCMILLLLFFPALIWGAGTTDIDGSTTWTSAQGGDNAVSSAEARNGNVSLKRLRRATDDVDSIDDKDLRLHSTLSEGYTNAGSNIGFSAFNGQQMNQASAMSSSSSSSSDSDDNEKSLDSEDEKRSTVAEHQGSEYDEIDQIGLLDANMTYVTKDVFSSMRLTSSRVRYLGKFKCTGTCRLDCSKTCKTKVGKKKKKLSKCTKNCHKNTCKCECTTGCKKGCQKRCSKSSKGKKRNKCQKKCPQNCGCTTSTSAGTTPAGVAIVAAPVVKGKRPSGVAPATNPQATGGGGGPVEKEQFIPEGPPCSSNGDCQGSEYCRLEWGICAPVLCPECHIRDGNHGCLPVANCCQFDHECLDCEICNMNKYGPGQPYGSCQELICPTCHVCDMKNGCQRLPDCCETKADCSNACDVCDPLINLCIPGVLGPGCM